MNSPEQEAESNVERIERHLRRLVGMPLHTFGRAADLTWWVFGRPQAVVGPNGRERIKGGYALHLQCSWRWVQAARIRLASDDRYAPASRIGSVETFDPDVRGTNLFDERTTELRDRPGPELFCEKIEADISGGLRILFSDGSELEVFADPSDREERWRSFEPGDPDSHLVVTGRRIEEEPI